MQTYHLADEFTDIAAEQALLASIIGTPTLYWDVLDLLTPEVFTKEADTWQAVALALEAGKSPHVPAAAGHSPDPGAAVRRGLCSARHLAACRPRLARWPRGLSPHHARRARGEFLRPRCRSCRGG